MVDHPRAGMDARILSLSSLVFLTAWASPSRVQRVDFRSIQNPTVIQFAKSSPAYAALEDARLDLQNTADNNKTVMAQTEKIVLIGKFRYPKVAPQILSLSPIEISRNIKTDYLAQLVKENPAPRGNIVAATRNLTVQEYGEILVKEELSKRHAEPAEKNIRRVPTASGREIIVQKPVMVVSRLAGKKKTQTNIILSGRKISWPKAASTLLAANQASEKVSTLIPTAKTVNTSSFQPSVPKRYQVTGELNLAGGAAWLGSPDSIRVYQMVDQLNVAEGQVDLKRGAYTLPVENVNGQIRAVAMNSQGQMIAEGRLNLLSLKESRLAKLDGQNIELRPVFNGVQAQVVSSVQVGESQFPVQEARLVIAGLEREIVKNKKNGLYEDASVIMPSQFLVSARHARHWSTYALAESGSEFHVRLFTQSFIEAFLNLTLNKYEARDAAENAIIWGRVSMQGRPVLGAKVRIVGAPDKQPIYMNGYLPDKTKIATVSKGEFAFSRVAEDEQLLQVSIGSNLIWPVLVPVAEKHVSYAELEIQEQEMKTFKSFDAFTDEPTPAVITPLGTEDSFATNESGETQLQVQLASGMTLIESQAFDTSYSPVRVALRTQQNEVHIPMIRKDWLTQLSGRTESPATAAVGFVNGDDFEVVLGDGTLSSVQIVYFDSEGKVSKGASRAGYAIYNLPRGVHTVTIIPEKSKQIVTQLIYIDEFAVQTTITNLMF